MEKIRIVAVVMAALMIVVAHTASVPSVKKVIYIDDGNWNSPQNTVLDAVGAGFNVVIIAFYMHTGPSDFVQAWEGMSSTTKSNTLNSIHAKGAILLVSFGGGADGNPYTLDAYSTGVNVGKWAKSQYFDGVDFDLENFGQGFKADGHDSQWTISWVINITNGALNGFGSGAVLTHAPQSPYFGSVGATNTWAGPSGGYTGVYNGLKDVITFFNVQFYNQGSGCYTDYNTLFENGGAGSCGLPGTSVKEINQAGIPLDKIVVGKPVKSSDAGDGYVAPAALHQYFSQAKSSLGWNAGVMGWEFWDGGVAQQWLAAINI